MSDNVRRIKLGDTRYRLTSLTREQKLLPNKAHYVASEWLFVSASDPYLSVVKKSSLPGNLIQKTIHKSKERTHHED